MDWIEQKCGVEIWPIIFIGISTGQIRMEPNIKEAARDSTMHIIEFLLDHRCKICGGGTSGDHKRNVTQRNWGDVSTE